MRYFSVYAEDNGRKKERMKEKKKDRLFSSQKCSFVVQVFNHLIIVNL